MLPIGQDNIVIEENLKLNNAMKEDSETRKKVRPAWLDTFLILAVRCGMNTALNVLYGVGIASEKTFKKPDYP